MADTVVELLGYVRNLMHQLFYLLQLHRGRVALHDVSDRLGVFLKAADQLFIGSGHAAALELGYLRLQAPRLIGQLTNNHIPDSEALVAGFTGRELALVAPGTLVTAWAGRRLHTRALAGGAMALLAGDATRVAIASWEHERDVMKTRELLRRGVVYTSFTHFEF